MREWIKLECCTPDKPEIISMAEILQIDQDAVLGKLARIWIWADQHTTDGKTTDCGLVVTTRFIDRLVNLEGFADAMVVVKWLIVNPNGQVVFKNFNRHNGTTAKARSLTARRVSNYRDRARKK